MVNKDGTIKPHAIIKGQSYRVVISKIGTGNVWGALDTIINETSGTRKEMRRKEWFELFKNYE